MGVHSCAALNRCWGVLYQFAETRSRYGLFRWMAYRLFYLRMCLRSQVLPPKPHLRTSSNFGVVCIRAADASCSACQLKVWSP